MNHLNPNLYGELDVVEKTGCDLRGSCSRPKWQIATSHGKKVFKQLQDNQDADYYKNYKKSFNRGRIIYPSWKSMPAINIMYANPDQFITMKKSELLEFVERKKPHVIAICEVKPKIPRERVELDYVILGYSLYPVNLDSNIRWGAIAYIHSSIDNRVIQINPDIKFSEVCLLEIRLCGGDNLLSGCFYRSLTTTRTSEKNNANSNNLLKYLSGNKCIHQCLVAYFNFSDINWFTWTMPYSEESKEAQFIELSLSAPIGTNTETKYWQSIVNWLSAN